MWYVPTIPFGFAMLGVGSVSLVQYLRLRRGDALLSLLIASIPLVIVVAAGAIRLIDKKIETAGTWVITEHANAFPVFENPSLGIEFRMSNQWFTLLYPCSARPPKRTFEIRGRAGRQDGRLRFRSEQERRCCRAAANAWPRRPSPIGRLPALHIGETSARRPDLESRRDRFAAGHAQSRSFLQRGVGPRRQPGRHSLNSSWTAIPLADC